MAATPNYDFIVTQVANRCGRHARVLDFGCGGGELVARARAFGLDMVGADPFVGCPDVLKRHRDTGALGKTVFLMLDGKLPFPEGSFDAVCANQVFEHVADLDLALAEIDRVLSPGGVLVSLTPTLEVMREGHCGIPFAQRLQGAPRLQFAYLLVARLLGLGLWKNGKSPVQWARDCAEYMQRSTRYRRESVLCAAQRDYIGPVERIEPDLAAHRLGNRPLLAALAKLKPMHPLTRTAVTRLANIVCIAQKPRETLHRS